MKDEQETILQTLAKPLYRSLRIDGYSTSVRLERIFWDVLDRVAAGEGMATVELVTELHREVYKPSD